MPTDSHDAHPYTGSAVRTKTGTEIHRAMPGSSRTDCGCRVHSGVSRPDFFKAQAAGVLCAKCWAGYAQTDAPAAFVERAADIDKAIAGHRAEAARIRADLDARREVQA